MEKGYTDLMAEVLVKLDLSSNEDDLVLAKKIHDANDILTHRINEIVIMMCRKIFPNLKEDQFSSFNELMNMIDQLKK